jgi:MFS family permease
MFFSTAANQMKVFVITWLGQSVSLIGSGLTGFALGVWVFQQTGSATQFALIGLCALLPRVILAPFAGALVDRWDRRWVMIISDSGAALCTILAALLLMFNRFEIWQVYLVAGFNAVFSAVQWPAYTATVSLIVPHKRLGRANGLMQFGQAAAEIMAPVLAGALVPLIRIQGVLLIDFATFIFGVTTLLLVRFPKPEKADRPKTGQSSFWREIMEGWNYLVSCKGLWNLLILLTLISFLWGMVGALIVPMILSFTSSTELGAILSTAGLGMLAGSLLMSFWGGPKRRIYGVLCFELIAGISFMVMGLRPSFGLIALGAFSAHVTIAMVYGSNQAIWQRKVPPEIQGRVFASQQMFGKAAAALAYILAGPLADRVFNPWLLKNGWMAGTMGRIIGVGPGRGIGLVFIMMGMIKIGVVLAAYFKPDIRYIEDKMPDAIKIHPHDNLIKVPG